VFFCLSVSLVSSTHPPTLTHFVSLVVQALVQHPAVQAVGFTGSLRAGRALFDAAAARPKPIPVYAEMGSINPVFILSEALQANGAQIAGGLAGSVTMGVGQVRRERIMIQFSEQIYSQMISFALRPDNFHT
jgi:acyl-CoA reductase-like NAD-dependent aldehyde dehydrogenase